MKSNIVLIGMTGSGKTTIGKQLSARLSMSFIDIDHYIEKTEKQTIPELFAVSEEHFREIEAAACQNLAAQQQRTVISCGGGVVLNQLNIQALRKTGWIILIDRPIEQIVQDIQTEHRPLLKAGTERLYQLYLERKNLYTAAADIIVSNTSSLEQVLIEIEKQLPASILSK